MSSSPFRRVKLPLPLRGRLYLTNMPGCWRPAGFHVRFWEQLTESGAEGWFLCLAGEAERRRKAPDYPGFLKAAKLGKRWLEFPIRDRSVPKDLQAFLPLLDQLIGLLHRPITVIAIHCAAGVGRTGMVAASLLVRLGVPSDEALQVAKSAGGEPETAPQRAVVGAIEALTCGHLATIVSESSEAAILATLLEHFDAGALLEQLAIHREVMPDELVTGNDELPRFMRAIQWLEVDFRRRSLNEIVVKALG